MTNYDNVSMFFPHLNRRKIEVNFNGGHITSDAGVLFLREIDNKLNLTREAASFIKDPKKITHSILTMLRQRVYGIALGYEDLNDQTELRHDIAIQTSLENADTASSASTLCRFETYANRKTTVKLHQVLLDRFISSFKEKPRELTLDFGATDDPVHGNQEGKFFHGHYGVGSPIKVCVNNKHTTPCKKIMIFFRLIVSLHHHSCLLLRPIRTCYFFLFAQSKILFLNATLQDLICTSHPSGLRLLCFMRPQHYA